MFLRPIALYCDNGPCLLTISTIEGITAMINASSTILVVDDYPDNRMLLATWLRAKGYKVIEASDGKEAVAMAMETKPDVCVVDYSLPLMNGLEAEPSGASVGQNQW
jgi:PleD family two-component response regulator